MKKISEFLSENFQFLVVKFSLYLNRHVFVMSKIPDQRISDILIWLSINGTARN